MVKPTTVGTDIISMMLKGHPMAAHTKQLQHSSSLIGQRGMRNEPTSKEPHNPYANDENVQTDQKHLHHMDCNNE